MSVLPTGRPAPSGGLHRDQGYTDRMQPKPAGLSPFCHADRKQATRHSLEPRSLEPRWTWPRWRPGPNSAVPDNLREGGLAENPRTNPCQRTNSQKVPIDFLGTAKLRLDGSHGDKAQVGLEGKPDQLHFRLNKRNASCQRYRRCFRPDPAWGWKRGSCRSDPLLVFLLRLIQEQVGLGLASFRQTGNNSLF